MSCLFRSPALLGLLLCASGVARADQLDVGKRLYHELEYDAARVALLRAAASPDSQRRAQAYLFLGLIDTVAGDDRAARGSFRAGLVLDPGLELPLGTSPKVARIFDAVKAQLASDASRAPPIESPPTLEPPPPIVTSPRQGAPGRSEPRASPSGAASSDVPPRGVPAGAVRPVGELSLAPPPPSHAGRWVSAAMIAVGVAAIGAGGYFGAQEQGAAAAAQRSGVTQIQAGSELSRAGQEAIAANVLFAAGALVAVAGGALLGVW